VTSAKDIGFKFKGISHGKISLDILEKEHEMDIL